MGVSPSAHLLSGGTYNKDNIFNISPHQGIKLSFSTCSAELLTTILMRSCHVWMLTGSYLFMPAPHSRLYPSLWESCIFFCAKLWFEELSLIYSNIETNPSLGIEPNTWLTLQQQSAAHCFKICQTVGQQISENLTFEENINCR